MSIVNTPVTWSEPSVLGQDRSETVSLRVYYRGEIRLFFSLHTIAPHYSLAYYLSYFPYLPSDYYLSETYVLATVITQNGCIDI